MKKMTSILLILCLVLSMIGLTGCDNSGIVKAHINDPIATSGDIAYYASMDTSSRKEACEEKHIAVSGVISQAGYTLFCVGDSNNDGIEFSCTFSDGSDVLDAIEEGDFVALHGVCTRILLDTIYLEGCQLTQHTKATDNPTDTIPEATTPTSTTELRKTTTMAPITTRSSTTIKTTIKVTTTSKRRTTTTTTKVTTSTKTTEKVTMVWIPESGKKYHRNSNCSNMKNPSKVTLTYAQDLGYTPCKKCY